MESPIIIDNIEHTYIENDMYADTNFYDNNIELYVTNSIKWKGYGLIKISKLIPNKQYTLKLYCLENNTSAPSIYDDFYAYRCEPFDPKIITYNQGVPKTYEQLAKLNVSSEGEVTDIYFTPTSTEYYIELLEENTHISNDPALFRPFIIPDKSGKIFLIPPLLQFEGSLPVNVDVLYFYEGEGSLNISFGVENYNEKTKVIINGIEYKTYEKLPPVFGEEILSEPPQSYNFTCYLNNGSILVASKTEGFGLIDNNIVLESSYISDGENTYPIYDKYSKFGPINGYQIRTFGGQVVAGEYCRYLYIKNNLIMKYTL
jgi:hypothetical protein